MKTKVLADILNRVPIRSISGNQDSPISQLTFDSRNAVIGSVFFAIKGTKNDGHDFISNVIENGCKIVVCEKKPTLQASGVTFVEVENAASSLAIAATNFFDHPSQELKLIGVTGTNGKTTIATLLHQLFENNGYPSGLISTIYNKIGKEILHSTHTTPDPISLNALLRNMVDKGCSYAFMEVSSHALIQMRTFGLHFSGGVFTNLTHDHLDYHGSFSAYRDAKKIFFDALPKEAFALVNKDDRNSQFMLQNSAATKLTYSIANDADFRSKVIENHFEGLQLLIDGTEVFTRLIGRFNASNLTAIYGASRLLGLSKEESLKGISELYSAEGRFEFVKNKQNIVGIVDYAHTPDALENVLNTLNDIRTRNEKLITVVGAGGDRDKSKRPEMAKIAARLSDILILTSDNPRSEDPQTIINEMRKGVSPENYKKTLAMTDRREAIHSAVAMATAGDIIIVAGKGHEKYQEIDGIKHPFDDKKELFERLLIQNPE